MGYGDILSLKGLVLGGGFFLFCLAAWFVWHFWGGTWWKRAQKKIEVPDDMLEEAIAKAKPVSPPAVSNYVCKCGQTFTELKAIQRHLLVDGRGHKGVHGIASKPGNIVVAPRVDVPQISETGKYWAYIWEPNPGIVLARITMPVGKIWLADTTLPHAGACYFCRRDQQGNLIPYDPRLTKYDPSNSPERLYRATNAEEVVGPVYTSISTWWEKFNTLAPYLIAGLLALAAIVKAGS